MISPSSYHVCERTVTVNVSKVVQFQVPHKEKVLCMGWLPWKLCSRTFQVTEYRTVFVPDTVVITECCEGYELVGHYCVMTKEKLWTYSSKPGTCPVNVSAPGSECTADYECQGLQKCCISSNGSFCVSPQPAALDRNTMRFWYNANITVKIRYEDLLYGDPGFTNHTRLLHAMVSGELWPTEVEVYHLSTVPAGPFTVLSRVLIGLNDSMPLQEIGTLLSNIAPRLPEVIDVRIEDLDECRHPMLAACSSHQQCVNTEGSYICSHVSTTHNPPLHTDTQVEPSPPHPEDPRPTPAGSVTTDAIPLLGECLTFLNHSISHVTSSGFHISWITDCADTQRYSIRISSEKGFTQSSSTSGNSLSISGLNAGEVYTVRVTFQDCDGQPQIWEEKVKTEAQILSGSMRIRNWNLTGPLLDPTSTDYADFVKKFISEVKLSLAKDVPPEKVNVEILSLHPGSIIANFLIIINDTMSPINLTAASLLAISTSSEFKVDPHSISLADFDECLSPSNNDCDTNADCKNLPTSYTCECHPGYRDMIPSRPGRKCEVILEDPPPLTSVKSTSGTYSTTTMDTFPPTTTTMDTFPPTTTMDSSPPTASSVSVHVMSPSSPSAAELHLPTLPNTREPSTTSETAASTANQTISTPPGMASSHLDTTKVTLQDSENKTLEHPNVTTLPTTIITTLLSTHQISLQTNTTGKHNSTERSSMPPATPNVTSPMSTSDKGANTTAFSMSPTTHSSLYSSNITVTSTTTPTPTTPREIPCSFPLTSASPNSESTHSPLMFDNPSTTQKSPSQSLKEASKVICEMGRIGISIEKNFLKLMSISSYALFLGSPECSVNCSTDTHVLILAGWKECNTDVDNNKTHMVVNTTLYISLSSTIQNASPRPVSQIRCTFQNDILWSSGYNPAGGIYTIIEKLEGGGSFLPEFQLFIGDQPIHPNFTLSATDDVTVQIRIKTEDPQYKVVINECWATPTENSNDPVSFPFIKDSCALTNTFTTILTNGISSNATFQTKIFSFVNNPIVYLHCRLHVCREEPAKTCRPTCGSFRAATTGDNVFTGITRMGPLHLARRTGSSEEAAGGTLGVGYIILIAVGVLAVIAIAVAVLICWHERRTGNYSFKIKLPEMGYQAFSN